jgi:hypothetical protein
MVPRLQNSSVARVMRQATSPVIQPLSATRYDASVLPQELKQARDGAAANISVCGVEEGRARFC